MGKSKKAKQSKKKKEVKKKTGTKKEKESVMDTPPARRTRAGRKRKREEKAAEMAATDGEAASASDEAVGEGSGSEAGSEAEGSAAPMDATSGSGSGEESAEDEDAVVRPGKMKKLLGGVKAVTKPVANWKNSKYRNKQRTLVFSSRGITTRHRHLLNDLRVLLPHMKKEVKFDSKSDLYAINEIAILKSCSTCIFFEARRKDLFLWVSRIPHGPSAKFLVNNVHTMDELKLTGNALRGSRPILSFDGSFDEAPHLQVLKEMFTQVFGTPNRHPKSKPFIDHVLSFSQAEDRIWFRNYQIHDKQLDARRTDTNLVEIGPRFVLTLVRIFEGSFSGQTLYENPRYQSPNQQRIQRKRVQQQRYKIRKKAERKLKEKLADIVDPDDEFADVWE